MKPVPKYALMVIGALLLFSLGTEATSENRSRSLSSNGVPAVKDRLDRILERLDTVEQMLENPPPTATATFCTSQGRAIELAGDLAAELKIEGELGPGWAEIADLKITAAPSIPAVLPILLPSPIPGVPPIPLGGVPIPTEVKVGLAGGIGRMTDLCIDITVELSPEDREQLRELERDINVSPLGFEKSKFQRRADRLLNYIARQIPGIQVDPDVATAYDRADAALASLMEGGLKESDEGLGVFRDSNVRELLASIDMPVNVLSLMNEPEQIFDGLPDMSRGVNALGCEDMGISTAIRARPRMDRLCQELDKLPDFEKLRDTLGELPDSILEAIAESLTAGGGKDGKFCSGKVGNRKVFNKYCSR